MPFFAIGALFAGLSVGLGAFGAHALADVLSEARLGTYDTATRYLFMHAVALMLCGMAVRMWPEVQRPVTRAGFCFLGGIAVFCGSLYLLIATDVRMLGAITPIGGVAFIAGWLLLARAGSIAHRSSNTSLML